MPSGEASSTGRSGSQMFSYQRSFKKKKKRESEARRQKHPSCRAVAAKQVFFRESPVERPDQASRGWARPESVPRPRHGREDARLGGRCVCSPVHLRCARSGCLTLLGGFPETAGKIALGSRWDGFNGKPQALRTSGRGAASWWCLDMGSDV